MDPVYLIAGRECLEELLDMRVEFLLSLEHDVAIEDGAAFRAANRAFMEEGFAAGTYMGFLCRLGGVPVSTLGILSYSLPPLDKPAPRKVAHVLNVYTKPDFRGRGYATELLTLAVHWARGSGHARVFLNATASGEPVYRRLGFREQDEKALVLPL
jgi:GNAT superfamily N-acetyltransferase